MVRTNNFSTDHLVHSHPCPLRRGTLVPPPPEPEEAQGDGEEEEADPEAGPGVTLVGETGAHRHLIPSHGHFVAAVLILSEGGTGSSRYGFSIRPIVANHFGAPNICAGREGVGQPCRAFLEVGFGVTRHFLAIGVCG